MNTNCKSVVNLFFHHFIHQNIDDKIAVLYSTIYEKMYTRFQMKRIYRDAITHAGFPQFLEFGAAIEFHLVPRTFC